MLQRSGLIGASSLRPVRKAQVWLWGLSRRVAVAAFGMVIAGVLLSTFSGGLGFVRKLSAVIPQPVRTFFESPAHVDPVRVSEQLKQAHEQIAPAAADSQQNVRVIRIGTSEADVLRIQGRPNRTAGSTWFYGQSEITFVGGRVVSWRESSQNPLTIAR